MDKTQAAAFSYLRFIRLNGESLYAGHFFTIFFRTMRSCPLNFYMAIHTRQEYPKELIQPEIKPENYTGTTARLAQIKLNGWESGLIDEGLIKPAYPFGDCRGNNSYGGQLPMAKSKTEIHATQYLTADWTLRAFSRALSHRNTPEKKIKNILLKQKKRGKTV